MEDSFIFCVGQEPDRIISFLLSLPAVPITPLVGSYKGEHELSFMAPMSAYRTIEPWLREEESILHLEASVPHPRATLLYLKAGTEIPLGYYQAVSQSEAMQHSGWTYNPLHNAYFVCKE